MWDISIKVLAGLFIIGTAAYGAKAIAFALKADPAANAASLDNAPLGKLGELAELLEPIRAKHKLPALAAAIVVKGELRAIGACGVRRAGGTEHITIHDAFHLGSCTKAMTATLIGMLVEDGILSWSTTVGEVFDELDMHDAWKHITIEQLLHNRGGAPADLHADGLWGRLWLLQDSPRHAREELVRGVLSREPSTIGNYVYSNAGFSIAGAMIEHRTDTSWEDLMRQRLFDPLDMATAGFGAPGNADELSQPRGHTASGAAIEPGPQADNPPAIAPANAVHCSLGDWAEFIAVHLASNDDDDALLTSKTIERMHTPGDGPGESYGMGWIVTQRAWAKADDNGSGRVLMHAGSNTLWYAIVWIAPERELALLIATNQGGYRAERACNEAASALLRHYLAWQDGAE